ncbi:MAG: hypothetical protein ACK40G_08225 [Cytophagaceae bacterium]
MEIRQYSLDGGPVSLEILTGKLLIIDPVVFSFLVGELDDDNLPLDENFKEFLLQLDKKYFPDHKGALLGYAEVNVPDSGFCNFNPARIDVWNGKDEDKVLKKDVTVAGSESGLMIIVDMINFERLLGVFNYENFIRALKEDKIATHLSELCDFLLNEGIAVVAMDNLSAESDGVVLYYKIDKELFKV